MLPVPKDLISMPPACRVLRLLVLIEFLALEPVSGQTHCAGHIDEGVQYIKPDHYQQATTATADGCCALCASVSKCGAWKWTAATGNQCRLLPTSPTKQQKDSTYISGTAGGPATPTPPSTPSAPTPPPAPTPAPPAGVCDVRKYGGRSTCRSYHYLLF